MNELKQKILSRGFIVALLILVLNDFYFKKEFPGMITGKISDFAGLFAFPYFLSALFPGNKKSIYISTVVAFVLWKLPYADTFISLWNECMPYSIGRVVDYSDYLALIILPLSFYYQPTSDLVENTNLKKVFLTGTIIFSIFSFLATAGTHGNIKIYTLNHSKHKIDQAFDQFYLKYPELAVPDSYKSLVTPHINGSKDDEEISKLNADSVNFEFYFERQNMIIWASFVGAEENWDRQSSGLALEGVLNLAERKWRYNDDLNKNEKQELTDLFQKEVLVELDKILNENH